MKILNLAYPELSEIKFQHVKYPDGQQNIIITDPSLRADLREGLSVEDRRVMEVDPNIIYIASRFQSFLDLEKIILAVKALDALVVTNIFLYIPYYLGARSDRRFSVGSTNYLRDIVSPIINSLNLKQVIVVDPHSDVLEATLNNFSKVDNSFLLKEAFGHLLIENVVYDKNDSLYLVSPDAGALKKIYDLAKQFDCNNVVCCEKVRDISTGKILKTTVNHEDFEGKDCFIVDDICDGGRTFIEIAKVLKERNCGKLYLVVTHGIFSQGLEPLDIFDKIFTTNSYQDLTSTKKLEVIEIFKKVD